MTLSNTEAGPEDNRMEHLTDHNYYKINSVNNATQTDPAENVMHLKRDIGIQYPEHTTEHNYSTIKLTN